MYLHSIKATNYRVFGDDTTGPKLDWVLNPGMNILVGENDAGKTAVIDAIRSVLWSTSLEIVRISEQDFHIHGQARATSMTIELTLRGLSESQEAALLEWLTYESDGTASLTLTLSARWVAATPKRRARVETMVRTGPGGAGPEASVSVREAVRATYLRPLRDAEHELRPGRASRLSQILAAHPSIAGQADNDFDPDAGDALPKTLVGLMAHSQHHVGGHAVIEAVENGINADYLARFAFAGEALTARIRLATELALNPVLEKFELVLQPTGGVHSDARCARGLGYNNVLFMATELVLLGEGEDLSLLLIEEPEAHLHPQLQDRVMALLAAPAAGPDTNPVQVVMTTHSPSLVAGAAVESMTLVIKGQTFSLRHGATALVPADYAYLRRFLEATRANLFFARGVAVVEGPGEALLLPAIAKACDRNLSEHGVSIVNVGDVGLYHYARILQRRDGVPLPVPVACITDRDVVPVEATYVPRPKKKGKKRFFDDYTPVELAALVDAKVKRASGGSTVVCVSDHWTLEYDLALAGCARLMHDAIGLAVRAKKDGGFLLAGKLDEAKKSVAAAWASLEAEGLSPCARAVRIYEPLYRKRASKAVAAQYAAALLESGAYGAGQTLFDTLPPYLRTALTHLTGSPGTLAP